MSKVLFAIIYSLLPMAAATAFVFVGSEDAGHDYWSAAPWLIIFSTPFCILAFMISMATIFIHGRTAGDATRKLMISALWLFVMTAGLVLLAAKFMRGDFGT